MNEKIKTKYGNDLILKCKAYGITAFLAIGASILLYYLIGNLSDIKDFILKFISVIAPILTGLIIAFVLNPVFIWLQKRCDPIITKKAKNKDKALRVSKYLCILLSILFGVAVVTVILLIIIPNVISSITELTTDMPQKIKIAFDWLSDRIPEDISITLQNKLTSTIEKLLSEDLFKSFETTALLFASGMKGLYNVFINIVVGIIISFYALNSKDHFKRIAQKLLCVIFKKETVCEIVITAKQSHKIFTNFIVGKLLDSLIIGIICFLAMLILGLPYALLISFIVGVTNVIPFFGPFIGAIPSAILIFLHTPVKALVFLLMILVLQQLDGNVIGPRILRGGLGISSFWVVFSIMLFGGFFGLFGMLIGAPLFAIIYNIVNKFVNKKLKQRGLSLNSNTYNDITQSNS